MTAPAVCSWRASSVIDDIVRERVQRMLAEALGSEVGRSRHRRLRNRFEIYAGLADYDDDAQRVLRRLADEYRALQP